MPKDEFDFEDPMELAGMALLTAEDTTDAMCECFIEEFMRMGYGPHQILALSRNSFYLGMNLVLENRGEGFVRERIAEVFARWGRAVDWSALAVDRLGRSFPAATPLAAAEPGEQPDRTTGVEPVPGEPAERRH